MDNLNKLLKKILQTLEELEDEGLKTRKLIRGFSNLEPVSGYGLFSLERSTLTSMVSVSLTYVIILLQFKQNIVDWAEDMIYSLFNSYFLYNQSEIYVSSVS